jgi:hypothetical protein
MNRSVKQSAQSFSIPERTLVWSKVLRYCSFLLLVRVAFRWRWVGGIGGMMVTGRKLRVQGRKPVPTRRCQPKSHVEWFRIENSSLLWETGTWRPSHGQHNKIHLPVPVEYRRDHLKWHNFILDCTLTYSYDLVDLSLKGLVYSHSNYPSVCTDRFMNEKMSMGLRSQRVW